MNINDNNFFSAKKFIISFFGGMIISGLVFMLTHSMLLAKIIDFFAFIYIMYFLNKKNNISN